MICLFPITSKRCVISFRMKKRRTIIPLRLKHKHACQHQLAFKRCRQHDVEADICRKLHKLFKVLDVVAHRDSRDTRMLYIAIHAHGLFCFLCHSLGATGQSRLKNEKNASSAHSTKACSLSMIHQQPFQTGAPWRHSCQR